MFDIVVWVLSSYVMSDSLWLHVLEPAGLLCPWDFPCKNTGVGCHFLLHGIFPTAAAKLLQLCPTLWDPIDGSPPGSPIPGILQARALEWVAISFSNAWEWKVKVKSLSHVRLLVTPWTAAHQAPPFMGFSRQEYWSGVPLPSPGIFPTHGSNLSTLSCVSCIGRRILYPWATWGACDIVPLAIIILKNTWNYYNAPLLLSKPPSFLTTWVSLYHNNKYQHCLHHLPWLGAL